MPDNPYVKWSDGGREAQAWDEGYEAGLKSIQFDGYWTMELGWVGLDGVDEEPIIVDQPYIGDLLKVLNKYSGYQSVKIEFKKFRPVENC